MRCFVAAWPAGSVMEVLEAFDRPTIPGLRWTTPDQWHVTLRFLGEVSDAETPALVTALEDALAGAGAVLAEGGPVTTELGGQLVLPVSGVEGLAEAVISTTAPFGDAPERRRFRGHLTLARTKRGSAVPRHVLDRPIEGTWLVESIAVVHSHLEPIGARYEEVALIPLA